MEDLRHEKQEVMASDAELEIKTHWRDRYIKGNGNASLITPRDFL